MRFFTFYVNNLTLWARKLYFLYHNSAAGYYRVCSCLLYVIIKMYFFLEINRSIVVYKYYVSGNACFSVLK